MAHELTQPYLRIVYDLRDQIREGKLQPNARVPSNRALRERYKVAAGTVQRALNELRAAGLIYSHQGRGSFVHAAAARSATSPASGDLDALQRQVADLTARLEGLEQRLDARETSKAAPRASRGEV